MSADWHASKTDMKGTQGWQQAKVNFTLVGKAHFQQI